MNTVPYVDANAKGYWEQVRKNASRRRARDKVKLGFANLRVSMIYEQYIADIVDLVTMAATMEGLSQDKEQSRLFIEECADMLGLPELLEDFSEIHSYAREAIREAQDHLYG